MNTAPAPMLDTSPAAKLAERLGLHEPIKIVVVVPYRLRLKLPKMEIQKALATTVKRLTVLP